MHSMYAYISMDSKCALDVKSSWITMFLSRRLQKDCKNPQTVYIFVQWWIYLVCSTLNPIYFPILHNSKDSAINCAQCSIEIQFSKSFCLASKIMLCLSWMVAVGRFFGSWMFLFTDDKKFRGKNRKHLPRSGSTVIRVRTAAMLGRRRGHTQFHNGNVIYSVAMRMSYLGMLRSFRASTRIESNPRSSVLFFQFCVNTSC